MYQIGICQKNINLTFSKTTTSPYFLSKVKLLDEMSIAEDYFLTSHSVLEHIWIKSPYPDPRLLQHESLYPIGLKSARIEIPHIGSHYIDFSKTDFY